MWRSCISSAHRHTCHKTWVRASCRDISAADVIKLVRLVQFNVCLVPRDYCGDSGRGQAGAYYYFDITQKYSSHLILAPFLKPRTDEQFFLDKFLVKFIFSCARKTIFPWPVLLRASTYVAECRHVQILHVRHVYLLYRAEDESNFNAMYCIFKSKHFLVNFSWSAVHTNSFPG
jgi:hypothetical protein